MPLPNRSEPSIAVLHNSLHAQRCRDLANELGLRFCDTEAQCKSDFLLSLNGEGILGIKDMGNPKMRPVMPKLSPRHTAKGGDPLMRAIGYKTHSVIDCTAGWGSDAAHIANHGIHVTAIEQHRVLFTMLVNALDTNHSEKLKAHLQFLNHDSHTYLNMLVEKPEVIYIDPMYPPKPGSASTKINLVLLQNLIGPATNQQDLVIMARQRARKRVIVKRPHYADPVIPGHSGSTEGKLVRFDIFSPI